MPYLKPAYEDQDHFTCARVLEFRQRFMRESSQATERIPASTARLAKKDNSAQAAIIHDGHTDRRLSRADKGGAMNQEQFKGNWNQLKGALKKQWGKFTDDDLLQIEGDQDKFHGAAQKRYGEMKEEISKWVDGWHAQHESVKTSSQ